MEGSSLGSNLIVVIEINILIESLYFLFNLANLLIEILLFSNHHIDELVLLFVQVIALLLNLLKSVTW